MTLDYARPLPRQIGLFGAVMLGLGSILGTGVFVGLAQATALAGPWVLLAILIAGALAYCNAMSSAQLAAAYPVSGGTYEYGYRLLSPTWGFIAGWSFLLAKSASAATAALGIATVLERYLPRVDFRTLYTSRITHLYLLNSEWIRLGALACCVSGVAIVATLAGLRRSSAVITIFVAITAAGLVSLVVAFAITSAAKAPSPYAMVSFPPGVYLPQLLQAAALVFVAFTGYGRLATLGEEVIHPTRNIPRAITITLSVSLFLYLAVGCMLACRPDVVLVRNGWQQKLISIAAVDAPAIRPLVSLAALTAMLGVLLNLILGLSRVWLAMGRRGDMPSVLAHVSERTGTPVPATILTGVVIGLLVLVGDVKLTWSFSAFSVLIYYAITNWACLRLPPEHRRYPRALAWAGLITCLSLAWFVEVRVWLVGVVLIGVGLLWHKLRARLRGTAMLSSPVA